MNIGNLTNKNLINLNLNAEDRKAAILELSDMLERDGKLNSKEVFIMDVIRREKESTTGFGHGFALPHGKSNGVKEPCFAIGRSKNGIRWESFDKKPVNFIILLAVPNQEAGASHLEILSGISEKLISEKYRLQLINAGNEQEIIRILSVQVKEAC